MKTVILSLLTFTATTLFSTEWLYYKHYPWVYDHSTQNWLYLRGSSDGKIYSFNATSNAWSEFQANQTSSQSQTDAIEQLINGPILNSDAEVVDKQILAGKKLGFYFGAQWCFYCKGFTPDLVNFRNTNKENFEIIFVSSDYNSNSQFTYMKEYNMDFYTMELNSDAANALSQKYEISGIPALIIVSNSGELITKDGRVDVTYFPNEAMDKWDQ